MATYCKAAASGGGIGARGGRRPATSGRGFARRTYWRYVVLILGGFMIGCNGSPPAPVERRPEKKPAAARRPAAAEKPKAEEAAGQEGTATGRLPVGQS